MKAFLYLGFLISLFSCGPKMYSYKFSMNESIKTHKLYYENDTFSVLFDFYPQGITMNLKNKSANRIKIHWDQMKMTENDKERPVQHILIHEQKFYQYQPPSEIFPGSGGTDLLVFANNISIRTSEDEEEIKIEDMYPRMGNRHNRDSIESLKGQRLALSIPVDINNVSYSWRFNFFLSEIKSKRMVNALNVTAYIIEGFGDITW